MNPSYPASGSVFVTSTIAWARWPLVMYVFDPLITYSSPSLTARVLIPATSEPASGSVIPMDRIFLPAIAGAAHSLLLLLGAERQDRRHRHVGLDGDPHRQPAAVGVHDLLGQHQRGVVVAALAAVLLGLVEAEEAELAHPLEHPVGERGLLPLLGVGLELLDHEPADRLAQLLVLVGEDEVLALGGEVGLERRRRWPWLILPEVNSRTSYFHCGTLPSAPCHTPPCATKSPRPASPRSRWTSPTRATRCPTSCSLS